MEQHGRLARADGVELAWSHIPAARAHADDPTVVFLPGFRSDMTGEKARTLADWAERLYGPMVDAAVLLPSSDAAHHEDTP